MIAYLFIFVVRILSIESEECQIVAVATNLIILNEFPIKHD